MQNTTQNLTKNGIIKILDEQSQDTPIVIQVMHVEEKAHGYAYRCQIHDKRDKLKVLIKNQNLFPSKIRNFDVIEVQKQNIKRILSGENSYIQLQKIKVLRNQQKVLYFGNKKLSSVVTTINKASLKEKNILKEKKLGTLLKAQIKQSVFQQSEEIKSSVLIESEQIQLSGFKKSSQIKLETFQDAEQDGFKLIEIDQFYNGNQDAWKQKYINLKGRINNKSDIKQGKTLWFDCFLEDGKGNHVDLLFFNSVHKFHQQVMQYQYYFVEKVQVIKDKNSGKPKIKILFDTKFIMMEDPLPKSRYTSTNIYGGKDSSFKYNEQPEDRNLQIVPDDQKMFNKIVHCLHYQGKKYQNAPEVFYVCDQFHNIRKINVWSDHNLNIPLTNQTILLYKVSHRGCTDSDTFHTSKWSKLLTREQFQTLIGLQLAPVQIKQTVIYRRPSNQVSRIHSLCQVNENGYYFVSVNLLFDRKQIKYLQKCHSCSYISKQNDGVCSCNRPQFKAYYNVICKISDETGTMKMNLYSTLVELLTGIDNRDSSLQNKQDFIAAKLMSLNLRREVLKIQVKRKEGRVFINGLNIFKRDIKKEIDILTQLSSSFPVQ